MLQGPMPFLTVAKDTTTVLRVSLMALPVGGAGISLT